MLRALLESLAALDPLPEASLSFLIVDNAPDEPVRAVVEACRQHSGLDFRYVVEPEPGIPYARNRALDEAAAAGADFVAFVDDDETVAPDWLDRLIAHQRHDGAHLVGGPVRLVAEARSGLVGRLIQNGIRRRYERKEVKNARSRRHGRDGGVTIITNNWLGDLAFLRAKGLRFDIGLRYSGGSDTALYHQAKSLGARTSWCPEAIVYETIPPERMSLAYQFRRARDQAATSFSRKRAEERRSLPVSLATAAGKVIFGGLLVLVSPLTAGRTLVDGVRLVGYGLGYGHALAGGRSRHYEAAHGK
jgi:glycosyltransferase involved in cell wall biosynthesis